MLFEGCRDQLLTIFTTISEYLLRHEDSRARDLETRLIPYTKNGVYGKFFEGESTVNFKDTFMVVEFEELKERKDLQSAIIQMVIVQMINTMFLGDRKTPFMIFFDEAWDMLRGNQTGVFIETLETSSRKALVLLIVKVRWIGFHLINYFGVQGVTGAFILSQAILLLT
ncbi:MAG: hypothetical protein HEEMFOPI_01432 [Holosporales bacterium]